jgi:citrate synthase
MVGLVDVPSGLEGVLVTDTVVGDVRGAEGFYHYRQYDAVALAARRSFEDVWHLLFEGELPSPPQQAVFAEEVRRARELPPAVSDVLPALAAGSASVMDALRTAVSFLGAVEGFQPTVDLDGPARRRDALRVCAAIPTMVAALHRLRHGSAPVPPDRSLGHGANLLWMLTGSAPDPVRARALEQYLVTTIDHGFSTSTFTVRVITSAGADVAAALVGGLGALSGPLHGGAPSRALELLDAVGSIEEVRPYVVDAVRLGHRLMGFGHRVYRTEDPRAVFLREVAERIGADRIDVAREIERAVVDVLAELKPGRQLYANVEFYAGVVMEHCGLPRELFTPTFAASRVVGWSANLLEQAADNRIIRPGARYVGPPPPQPVPEE